MTNFELRPAFDSTSAVGAMLMRPHREQVSVGFTPAGLGTSSERLLPAESWTHVLGPVRQTTGGASIMMAEPAGPPIGELRRVSGLTWDQLARLFKVSRRSLHFWASGRAMTPGNEEHLQRLLAVLRKIDRGSAAANRTAVLAAHEDGDIPFDMLVAGNYDQVVALLGVGVARRAHPPNRLAETIAARAPRPPEELVGALQDRIHPSSGRLLARKAVRVPRSQ